MGNKTKTGTVNLFCEKCGDLAPEGLFRLNATSTTPTPPAMVCCKCKYGSPMRPFDHYQKSLFTSRPQPKDLNWYDKNWK